MGLRHQRSLPDLLRTCDRMINSGGGKFHQVLVLVQYNAEEHLDAYGEATGIGSERGTALWPSMISDATPGPNCMVRVDVFRIVTGRVQQAELSVAVNYHSFQATGITANPTVLLLRVKVV